MIKTRRSGNRKIGGLRYETIAKSLRKEIEAGQLCEGNKLPTEKALCERFGVSHLTIRRALAQLVEQGFAIRKQGVGTFVASQDLSRGAVRPDDFYIVLVTSFSLSFLSRIVHSIEEHARTEGRSIILCCSSSDAGREESDLKKYIALGFRRFIVTPIINDAVYYDNLKTRYKLRLIFLDTSPNGSTLPVIKTDDVLGAARATEYLLRTGHEDILHLAGPKQFSSARERTAGYQQAMANAKPLVIGGGYTINGGYNATFKHYHNRQKVPSAIFAANDLMAIGAMQALQELGLAVPQDVAVMGYGGLEVGKNHALSTVFQDCSRLGQLCVEAIESSFYDLPRLRERLIIEPELLIRQTA